VRLSPSTLRRPAAVLAAAVVLAGCGGAGSSEPAQDRVTPLAAVQAASQTTAEAGPSRFELTVSTEADGQSFELAGSGVLDPVTGEGESTFELPGGMGTLEQRIVDGQLYMTVPGQPGFFQLALEDLVGTPLEAASDPSGSLEALQGASDDVEEVGREDVRGEPTTHYRGTMDPEVAIENLGGAMRDAAGEALADVESFPFEAWIDDDGRIRRYTAVVELPASDATGGTAVTATTTMELFDFGVEVDVEAPPADQVQDGAPLLEALRGQQPG